MSEKKREYYLNAVCTVTREGVCHRNSYTEVIAVTVLKEVGQHAAFYDKSLNMYFKDKSALGCIYEIEFSNVHLRLSGGLAKAADFIRRTMYRYDWLQVRVGHNGRLVSVENTEELRKQWTDIRKFLLNDYQGAKVENYIKEIDIRMSEPDYLFFPMSVYSYLGLVFPGIPSQHDKNGWRGVRSVGLSDEETERFEQEMTFESCDEGNRRYKISGRAMPDSLYDVKAYGGYAIVAENEILPQEVRVDIAYSQEETDVQWKFELIRW